MAPSLALDADPPTRVPFRDDVLSAWLLREAPQVKDLAPLIAAFAERVRAIGIPAARVSLGLRVLHPQVHSLGVRWSEEEGATLQTFERNDDNKTMYEASPIRVIYEGGARLHLPLSGDPTADPYPIMADLRQEGFTDYAVLPVPFSAGTQSALTFATAEPEGFTPLMVEQLERSTRMLTPILEIHQLKHVTRTLLNTYVGPRTGTRVLQGEIEPGTGATIDAVILFADLRGFTELAAAHSPEETIGLLNAFFVVMTDAVAEHGGETLKFIGDALLAVFEGEDGAPACRALAAARGATAALDRLNAERAAAGTPPLQCGIALHAGEVLYGNVGGRTRLDFTVIGSAVNLAARLQNLCRELDETILLSADFVARGAGSARCLGHFAFKGLLREHAVYRPE